MQELYADPEGMLRSSVPADNAAMANERCARKIKGVIGDAKASAGEDSYGQEFLCGADGGEGILGFLESLVEAFEAQSNSCGAVRDSLIMAANALNDSEQISTSRFV